jgi:hypothetical protein
MFMKSSDYDKIPLRYCTLSGVQDYWRNKADGYTQQIRKWSRYMGHLVRAHPTHTDTEPEVIGENHIGLRHTDSNHTNRL